MSAWRRYRPARASPGDDDACARVDSSPGVSPRRMAQRQRDGPTSRKGSVADHVDRREVRAAADRAAPVVLAVERGHTFNVVEGLAAPAAKERFVSVDRRARIGIPKPVELRSLHDMHGPARGARGAIPIAAPPPPRSVSARITRARGPGTGREDREPERKAEQQEERDESGHGSEVMRTRQCNTGRKSTYSRQLTPCPEGKPDGAGFQGMHRLEAKHSGRCGCGGPVGTQGSTRRPCLRRMG